MIQSTASSKSVIKNQIKTIFWRQIYVCLKDNTWPKLLHKKGIKVVYTITKTTTGTCNQTTDMTSPQDPPIYLFSDYCQIASIIHKGRF